MMMDPDWAQLGGEKIFMNLLYERELLYGKLGSIAMGRIESESLIDTVTREMNGSRHTL